MTLRHPVAIAGAAPILAAVLGMLPAAVQAQVEFSVYGGYQTSPHSTIGVTGDPIIPDESFAAGWEGRSFEAPPYYGLRATWWQSAQLGFGIDFVHAKVYADAETLADRDYGRLEFSDGINILTLNAYRRWDDGFAGLTPYAGGGVGISIPHVEVTKTTSEGTSETFGYQLTGPAVTWIAGATYPISEQWSVFGEYKGTYSINEADLDSGGTLETDIITNALNLGVSFSF